ncbi:MAG TPA: type II toxin-antitoxin system VapC family toxin [Longimicrobiales bacterium]|nr:type II toxin-antitoxin system VapC family toxin [Longimicrobiales bacterium]
METSSPRPGRSGTPIAEPAPGPLILDTHVWLWSIEGRREQLSGRAVRAIEAASRRGEILIPAICVWEVAMLEAKGRIGLSQPLEEWVRKALRAPGARLLDLSPEIAVESARLPGSPQGDPADRLIIASARVAGARVATRDERTLAYGREGYVGILDVTR